MSRPNGHFCLSVRWWSSILSFPGDLFQFVTVKLIYRLFGPSFKLFLIVLVFLFCCVYIVVKSVFQLSCRRHCLQQGIKFITSMMNMFKGTVRPDEIGLHSKENLKHIFPKYQIPNTKFIFPKQIFIIQCGPSLPMGPKARVLALISVMPILISAVY
jgi:hypothetical protein